MLDHELTIVIPGRAAPKGNLKCVGQRGRGGRHVLVESNEGGHSTRFRETIAGWVRRRWPAEQKAAKGQPIGGEITFTLERPKSHYGTGRNERKLKPAYAGAMPVGHGTGDIDKLLRNVLDALQDTDVLPDDCAVVEALARKTFVDGPGLVPDGLGYPGVVIRLYPYDPAGA